MRGAPSLSFSSRREAVERKGRGRSSRRAPSSSEKKSHRPSPSKPWAPTRAFPAEVDCPASCLSPFSDLPLHTLNRTSAFGDEDAVIPSRREVRRGRSSGSLAGLCCVASDRAYCACHCQGSLGEPEAEASGWEEREGRIASLTSSTPLAARAYLVRLLSTPPSTLATLPALPPVSPRFSHFPSSFINFWQHGDNEALRVHVDSAG